MIGFVRSLTGLWNIPGIFQEFIISSRIPRTLGAWLHTKQLEKITVHLHF